MCSLQPAIAQYSNNGVCELPLFEDWSSGGGANPCACKWMDPSTGVTLCSYGNCSSAEFDECINDCVDGSPAPAGWIQGGGNQGFTICAVQLPVGLTFFQGNAVGRNINLKWETSSEENNERFEVWYSHDGIEFIFLEYLNGAGTTTELSEYLFIHQNPVVGVHYYQLKQVDYDGRYSLSSVIAVNNEFSETNTIFSDFIPNPANTRAGIFYRGGTFNKDIEITVYDQMGAVVLRKSFHDYSKFQALQLDLSSLKSALYQVQITQGNNIEFKRLSVIK